MFINYEAGRIKDFDDKDLQSGYTSFFGGHHLNKHGRKTYIAPLPTPFQFVIQRMNTSAPKAIFHFFDGKFHDYDREFRNKMYSSIHHDDKYAPSTDLDIQPRSLNEVLFKMNINSVLGFGITAGSGIRDPLLLLNLLMIKKDMEKTMGLVFPLYFYNNYDKTLAIDYLQLSMGPNQSLPMDIEKTLARMVAYYPKCKISISSTDKEKYPLLKGFIKNNILDLNKIIEYMRFDTQDIIAKQRLEQISHIEQAIQSLSKFLPPIDKEDKILIIHKKGRKDIFPWENYAELNQDALKTFIATNLLKLPLPTTKIEREKILTDPRFIYYKKAYNLQFRLQIYK